MGATLPATRGGPGFFPISIKLADRHVLVVGGGRAALIESRRLVDFGALVEVVAPHPVSELQDASVTYGHRIALQKRAFGLEDEDKIAAGHFVLVFACSNSADENEYVAKLANDAGILVCMPDSGEPLSTATFVVPSVRKRGHVKIAVSTDGYCPALARTLLERIESSLGGKIDNYVIFLDGLRERLVRLENEFSTDNERQQFLRRLTESEELILAFQRENFEEAAQLVEMIVAEVREPAST